MTQIMWLLWWPKSNAAAKSGSETGCATASTNNAAVSTTCQASSDVSPPSHCYCLTKLVRKLRRYRRRSLRSTRRLSSFQCRYDPMSYSLNFDTSGSGSCFLDEDYHRFCSFSSRFVVKPRTSTPCPRLVLPSTS